MAMKIKSFRYEKTRKQDEESEKYQPVKQFISLNASRPAAICEKNDRIFMGMARGRPASRPDDY